MKTLLLSTVIISTLFWSADTSNGAIIEDVHTEPNQPTDIEIITIVSSGIWGSGPVFIDDSDFQIEEASLKLDIFFTLGPYATMTPWSHSEVIGTLPADDYSLTVRAYNYSFLTETYELSDTYSTGFTVVPEPTTIFLFAFTGLLIRKNKRHKYLS